MRPVLAKWLLLWLRARKLPKLEDSEVVHFLVNGNRSTPEILNKVRTSLGDEHVKMLNLSYDWLQSFLPFVLQKINRVHYGLLHMSDILQLQSEGVKIPTSRKLTAVPFVAKDVPSRASEFAQPDVVIGLTIMAFRYEGLREKDFEILMYQLRERLGEESGPYSDRPSCQQFEQWILSAGKRVRGSKRKEINAGRRSTSPRDSVNFSKKAITSYNNDSINIFAEVFQENDDLIWPLQLIDSRDKEQFKVLFPLLNKLPHTVIYYLNELIFPEVLAHQGLKLSACGQELGGDMLFGKRIGFSGTPSDILPRELGGCNYERGSDGRVIHYLTSPTVASHVDMPVGWTVDTILQYIAMANPPFHALIDTGALVTGMSNLKVAQTLLDYGLSEMKGVVFLDEFDRQMVLLRKGSKVVKLADSGLAWGERFTFYDQVHTTGMDIKQAVDARAALTLGKDMVFRDYAQGAFRMRGIGRGQTICLLVVPEISERIITQVSIGSGRQVPRQREERQYLKDVLSWLTVNSMRVDGIQFSLLCEQSVGNVWRKVAFSTLREDRKSAKREFAPGVSNDEFEKSINMFRERIDHAIENNVPISSKYSEKIFTLIEENK